MLGRRRRRRSNINLTLVQCLVCAGDIQRICVSGVIIMVGKGYGLTQVGRILFMAPAGNRPVFFVVLNVDLNGKTTHTLAYNSEFFFKCVRFVWWAVSWQASIADSGPTLIQH